MSERPQGGWQGVAAADGAAATVICATKEVARSPVAYLGIELVGLLPERASLLLGLFALEQLLSRALVAGVEFELSALLPSAACVGGYLSGLVLARPLADLRVAQKAQGRAAEPFKTVRWRSLATVGLWCRVLPEALWLTPLLCFLAPIPFLRALGAEALIERLGATAAWLLFLGPLALTIAVVGSFATAALAAGDARSGAVAIGRSAQRVKARPLFAVGLSLLLAGIDLFLTWLLAQTVAWSGPAIEVLRPEELLAWLPQIISAQQTIVAVTTLSAATSRALQQVAWSAAYDRGKSAKPT